MSLSIYLQKNDQSYEEFGALIGVTGTAVYRYVRGIRIPEPPIMERIYQVTKGELTANDFYHFSLKAKKSKRRKQ